jgi:hypothetical protein
MKNILPIIAVAILFAACSSNSDLETKKDVILTDTTTMYNSNVATDTGTVREVYVAPPPPVEVRTITKTVYVDRKVPAPRRTVRAATPSTNTYPNNTPNQTTGTNPQNTGTGSTTTTGNTGTTDNTGTTTTPAPKPQKEGMSNATKGAVIGGVGGAIGGAILSKKKGKGAIIGGVVGAAGGYILGKRKDNRDSTR